MKKQLTHLALFTCITAAGAFGVQIATADTSSPADRTGECCRQHKGPGGHRGQHFMRMGSQLGLTEQQKTQAKALFEASRDQNKPLINSLMSAKQQLRALVQSGSADEAAIRAQAAKVAAAEEEMAVKKAQATKQFLALLTTDQAAKLEAMRASRELKSKKFRHGGNWGPME